MAIKTYRMAGRAVSLFLLIVLFSATAQARIITVNDDGPADFNNIQAEINTASTNDEIIIHSHKSTLLESDTSVLLYDVDFSTPPHTVGQPPVTGTDPAPRKTPTRINFDGPIVVDAVMALDDQPVKFTIPITQRYAQLEFGISGEQGFSEIFPRYIIEMDFLLIPLTGNFSVFLDTISSEDFKFKRIDFESDGTIKIFIPHGVNKLIGNYAISFPYALKIDFDLEASCWSVFLDGERIYSDTLIASALKDMRLSLGDSTYGNMVAVDNIKVYGLNNPASLVGVEIVGPEQVTENWFSQYDAIAYYTSGCTRCVTKSAFWSLKADAYATIDDNGLLLTKDVDVPQDVTICTEYVENDVIVEALKNVHIYLHSPFTFYVPSDFATIQEAIDAANDGDIVIVAEGIYTGFKNRNIDFGGKVITVRSENGPENCIINCQEKERAFYFHSGEIWRCILDGFTITGGRKDFNGYGGGILCDNSSPTIQNCVIIDNLAGRGGGIGCRQYSKPTIINCKILGNKGNYPGGGGIYCQESSPLILGCIFENNWADNGGGIYCETYSNAIVSSCIIKHNRSYYSGSGIYCIYSSDLTITDCLIINNEKGGISCLSSSEPALINCTITGNLSNGGVYTRRTGSPTIGNPTLINCIVYDNEPEEITGNGTPLITYSNIKGGWSGIGNINDDPCFVDPFNGDYHLFLNSPCINAGDTNYTAEPNEMDLDGNPRVTGGRIDMGAYEAYYRDFLISTQCIAVPEGGTSTFTVKLLEDPLEQIEVTVSHKSGDPDITIASGALLTFDSWNYEIPQTVVLAAAEDPDRQAGTAIIQIIAHPFFLSEIIASELENEPPITIFVDTDATGANNGTSWADAFNDLQDGLAATLTGDQIHVAQGIYKPVVYFPPPPPPLLPPFQPFGYGSSQDTAALDNYREATFHLRSGVIIKGGYAGIGSHDPNERDIELYETILSGDLAGNDEPNFVNYEENSYHVVTGSGCDQTTVLDGFTITSGNSNGIDPKDRAGGGMTNINASSPTITGCTFSENSASVAGGGMYNGDNSNPILTNCTFSRNWVGEWGGAVCVQGSAPELTNCVFLYNSADYGGGGIFCSMESNAKIINCTITGNRTNLCGGGIWSLDECYPIVTNSILWSNVADLGSQIALGNPDYPEEGSGSVSVNYSDVEGGVEQVFAGSNYMLDWGSGNIDIDPCFVQPGYWEIFIPPLPVQASDPYPFDVATGVSVYTDLSWMAGSYATSHDVYFGTSNPPPFTGNQISTTFDPGIMEYDTTYYWRVDELNISGITAGDVWSFTTAKEAPPPPPPPPPPPFSACADDVPQYIWIEGYYHLQADSPCIDTGDPNYVAEPNETDLDGRPRVINSRIDMGAYEYDGSAIQAELDIDPDTLNLTSKGNSITAYIRLSEEYDVTNIDPNSILLEGQVKPERFWLNEDNQIAEAKFDREQVQAILAIGDIKLTIIGQLVDGASFEASDIIKVIDKGGKK